MLSWSIGGRTTQCTPLNTLLPRSRYSAACLVFTCFFTLSGLLFTSLLLNARVQTGGVSGLATVKNFYIRRALRIFPIYYLLVFLCLAMNCSAVMPNLPYLLTYTSNLLPYRNNQASYLSYTWSLAVEEQFYLLWPWLVIFVNLKYLKQVFLGFIALGLISKYVVIFLWHHHYPSLMVNSTDYFGFGALYAWYRMVPERCKRFERFFVTVLPLLLFFAWRLAPLHSRTAGVMYVFIANCFITLAPIVFVLNNRSELVRRFILENPLTVYIGKISYGIYLYHIPVGTALTRFFERHFPPGQGPLGNYWVQYSLKLGILFAVASLSYYLLERPLLRIKKKFELVPSQPAV